MKKETRHLLRKIVVGSLALLVFMVVVLSSLHFSFPGAIGLWVVFALSGGSVVIFIIVILLLEYYARRVKKC